MTIPLSNRRKAIAVVGGGIAGLGAAWALAQRNDVTIFDRNAHWGGHANTVEVTGPDGRSVAVDTGFIVYNALNYPNLVRLFGQLDVPTAATTMSFAVSLDDGRFEYAGGDLAGLFAQKSNLLRPRFWQMISDILRFYRRAPMMLRADADDPGSLQDYLLAHHYSAPFIQDHLLPMAAAIWSAPADTMLAFPARSFVRFCQNHGLLQLTNRPQWRTVVGGSREYVRRLREATPAQFHASTPVRKIRRSADGVLLRTDRDQWRFDAVVLAGHADESLALLEDPTPAERRALGAFRYQANRAVLHGDPRLMPRRRSAWSAWNYLAAGSGAGRQQLSVTYWMNALQPLGEVPPLFVTLNPNQDPAPERIFREFAYDHPVFDGAAMQAQSTLPSLQGVGGIWYCGSYFGYGFHEDGLRSGLQAAAALDAESAWSAAAPILA